MEQIVARRYVLEVDAYFMNRKILRPTGARLVCKIITVPAVLFLELSDRNRFVNNCCGDDKMAFKTLKLELIAYSAEYAIHVSWWNSTLEILLITQ